MKEIKKKVVNYINNDDLVKSILEWQEKCREVEREYCELYHVANFDKISAEAKERVKKSWPIIPDYIGKAILQICYKLSTRYNFGNYSYRDEFVSDGIEACLKAVKTFDVTRVGKISGKVGNAFNYLTMVAYRAMQRRIITERQQNAIKHKHYQHYYLLSEIDGNIPEGTNNEHSNRIIEEYEEKHLKKLTKETPSNKSKLPKSIPKKEKPNVEQKVKPPRTANSTRSRGIYVKGK